MAVNLKNYSEAAPLVANPNRYVDIDLRFNRHPGSNDVGARVNSSAIAQSLRTICLTNPGDIDEEEDFGVGVWGILGENFTPIEILSLKDRIRDQCTRYEPRAELTRVDVEHDYASYTIRIRILYFPVNVDQEETVTVTVSRVL